MGSNGAAQQASQDRNRANQAIDRYTGAGYDQMQKGEARMNDAYGRIDKALTDNTFSIGYNNPTASKSVGFLENFIGGQGQIQGDRGMGSVMSGLAQLANGTQAGNDPLQSAFRGQDTQSQFGAMFGQVMQGLLGNNAGSAGAMNEKALADAASSFGVGNQSANAALAARGFGPGSGIGAQAMIQNQFNSQKAVADARANTALQVAGLNQQGLVQAGGLYSALRGQDQQYALGVGNLRLQDAGQMLQALSTQGQFQQGMNQFDQANLVNRANVANQLLATDMNRQQLNNNYQGQLLGMLSNMGQTQYTTGANMSSPQFAQQQYQLSNQNAQAAAQGQGQMIGGLLNFGANLLTAPLTGGLSLFGRMFG